MSLNNIRLNTQLLAQLYAHTLVALEGQIQDRVAPVQEVSEHTVAPEIVAPDAPLAANPAPIVAPELLPANEPTANIAITPHLGGNGKGVLILVSNESTPFLPDAELEFLSAILSACKLSIADVAIVNLHRHPPTYTQLLQQFNSRQVLLFNIEPHQIDLPLHFPPFQLQQFDGRTYLSAHRLAEMADDKALKTQLWQCLKTMFGV